MATTVNTLLTELSSRIRDSNLMSLATAFPPDPPVGTYSPSGQAFAIQILNDAQAIVNILEKNVVSSVPYTLTAGTSFIQVSSDPTLKTAIIRPIGIQLETGYDLVPMKFSSLPQVDLFWQRTRGIPRSWGMIGMDAFFVYPQAIKNMAVTVVGYTLLTTLLHPSDTIQIDDTLVHKLLDLSEAMAYLKMRNLDFYRAAMTRVQQAYPGLAESRGLTKGQITDSKRERPFTTEQTQQSEEV